jgi:hypothetical protein
VWIDPLFPYEPSADQAQRAESEALAS